MERQARLLLTITKQLSTPHLPQLAIALSQCNTLLHTLQSADCLNTLVITLLDLFNTTKYSYARDKIARMLCQCQCSPVPSLAHTSQSNSKYGRNNNVNVYELPTRQQIVVMVMTALGSNDTVVYILALQIVQAWTALFEKDTSLLIHLFAQLDKFTKTNNKSKLSSKQSSNKSTAYITKQHIRTVQCLQYLLQYSQSLSTTLHSTLQQLSNMGSIPMHVLLYLCSSARFPCGSYRAVIGQLWQMIRDRNTVLDKKRACWYYFAKLLYRACLHDYECVDLYEKQFRSKNLFMGLSKPIQQLKSSYYTFMASTTKPSNSISEATLLDICYESYQILQTVPEWVHQQVVAKVRAHLQKQELRQNTLLFSYYLPAVTITNLNIDSHLSSIFTKHSQHPQLSLLRLLKISLVCCTYSLSLTILTHFLSNQPTLHSAHNISVFVLLISYVELHTNGTAQNFEALLAIMGNLAEAGGHHQLLRLGCLWKQYYQNKGAQSQIKGEENSEDNDQIVTNIRQYQPEPLLKYKYKNSIQQQQSSPNYNSKQSQPRIPCTKQIQNMYNILYNEMVQEGSTLSIEMKIVNDEDDRKLLMPQRQHLQSYRHVYFGKQTILDIFKSL